MASQHFCHSSDPDLSGTEESNFSYFNYNGFPHATAHEPAPGGQALPRRINFRGNSTFLFPS